MAILDEYIPWISALSYDILRHKLWKILRKLKTPAGKGCQPELYG